MATYVVDSCQAQYQQQNFAAYDVGVAGTYVSEMPPPPVPAKATAAQSHQGSSSSTAPPPPPPTVTATATTATATIAAAAAAAAAAATAQKTTSGQKFTVLNEHPAHKRLLSAQKTPRDARLASAEGQASKTDSTTEEPHRPFSLFDLSPGSSLLKGQAVVGPVSMKMSPLSPVQANILLNKAKMLSPIGSRRGAASHHSTNRSPFF